MKQLFEYSVNFKNKPSIKAVISIDTSKDKNAAHKHLWVKHPDATDIMTKLADPKKGVTLPTMKQITRSEYMKNSSELHHAFYLQFANPLTYRFIESRIGIDKLLSSKDEHLNDLYKHSNGGAGSWIWDSTPINTKLAVELGAGLSPSTFTCVGKAVAKELIKQHKEAA